MMFAYLASAYVAYGEGQFGSTASGVFSSLAVFVAACLAFGVYAYSTYPADRR